MRTFIFAVTCSTILFSSSTAPAQTRPMTIYYQNVPLSSGSSPFSAGGLSDFNRFRVTSEPVFGDVSIGVAYEHALTVQQQRRNNFFVGAIPGGGEWLKLQWTIQDRSHVSWQHRFDRLNVRWTSSNSLEITAGRQTISWATTLLLTPADPFMPFDPIDPFREFRAGVDALRVRFSPGPLSELDVVVRPTKTAVGEEMTVLGRGLTTWRGWELSGWGGVLYGQPAGALGFAGGLFSVAVRGEVSFRNSGNELVLRRTIGVDRRFSLFEKDLYVVVEYQHDPFGAFSAEQYEKVLASKHFIRSELQTLGEDEMVAQVSYQLHPLANISFLWLTNLSDGSNLVSPSFSYSASDEVVVVGGVFLGAGEEGVGYSGQLRSEYGSVGATAYLSISVFL